MNWTVVQRILGLLLMMFSLTMLPPVLVAILFNEEAWLPFVEGFGITLAAGLLIWLWIWWTRRQAAKEKPAPPWTGEEPAEEPTLEEETTD